jgi:hypothetical protein
MIHYLGGLRREVHDVKTGTTEDSAFEPSMVIMHPMKKGKSFIITLDAFWKYVDPKDNADALQSDLGDFKKKMDSIQFSLMLTNGMDPVPRQRHQALQDLAHWFLADSLYKSMGVLPSVCYNLVKCLTMFDIPVIPASAAQLLLFIQDGLEDMKNYRPHPGAEKVGTQGEVTLWEGSTKIATREIEVKEDDFLEFKSGMEN